MGFNKGRILEPSCGVGNFFGLVPQSMSNSTLYGVELDTMSSKIAGYLIQKQIFRIRDLNGQIIQMDILMLQSVMSHLGIIG